MKKTLITIRINSEVDSHKISREIFSEMAKSAHHLAHGFECLSFSVYFCGKKM